MKQVKKLDIRTRESNKKVSLAVLGILTILLSVIGIITVDIIYNINLHWAIQLFLVLNWFILFSWSLYMVRSNKGVLAVAYYFNLILLSIVVITSCIMVFVSYIVVETILWTTMILVLIHLIYSGIAYRPWWFIKGRKY